MGKKKSNSLRGQNEMGTLTHNSVSKNGALPLSLMTTDNNGAIVQDLSHS